MMMKVDSRKLTFEEKEIVEHDTYRVSQTHLLERCVIYFLVKHGTADSVPVKQFMVST